MEKRRKKPRIQPIENGAIKSVGFISVVVLMTIHLKNQYFKRVLTVCMRLDLRNTPNPLTLRNGGTKKALEGAAATTGISHSTCQVNLFKVLKFMQWLKKHFLFYKPFFCT